MNKVKLNALSLTDKIQKVIEIYEDSFNGLECVCVFKNYEVCDADFTSILFLDCTFFFEFDDEEVGSFQVKVEDISDIIFDGDDSMKISILKLNNGDVIMIHCF